VGLWLQNLVDPDVVHRLVAKDAIYVSLNTENEELKKILPWAGTSRTRCDGSQILKTTGGHEHEGS
jgi:hypothetical protein